MQHLDVSGCSNVSDDAFAVPLASSSLTVSIGHEGV
jgi:hypothetical protein